MKTALTPELGCGFIIGLLIVWAVLIVLYLLFRPDRRSRRLERHGLEEVRAVRDAVFASMEREPEWERTRQVLELPCGGNVAQVAFKPAAVEPGVAGAHDDDVARPKCLFGIGCHREAKSGACPWLKILAPAFENGVDSFSALCAAFRPDQANVLYRYGDVADVVHRDLHRDCVLLACQNAHPACSDKEGGPVVAHLPPVHEDGDDEAGEPREHPDGSGAVGEKPFEEA